MNSVESLVATLTPDMVAGLKQAVALGRFPDGRLVRAEQKEWMLEAIIRYEASYVPASERTGHIERGDSDCVIPHPDDLIMTTRSNHDD